MQLLTQETRDKLQTLTKIADAIDKAGEEETQVREELNCIILESEKELGPLAGRLVTLDDQYQHLAELEQELMDIRKRGNIITHEKRVKVENTETISQDTIESLRKMLESPTEDLSTAYKAAQPIQSNIDHLGYKTETAKKFIDVVNDKYAFCLKDKSIGKEFQKLKYTIKLANLKVKELEQNVKNGNDDAEVILKRSSNRKSFQESLPYSRITGNTGPDIKGLKASPPSEKVPLAHPDASNPNAAANGGSNGGKNYSFLFKYARWGGEGGAYNGNPNRKKNYDIRIPKRSGNHGGSPDGNDPDDGDKNEGSGDDDTPNGDGHLISGNSYTPRSLTDLRPRCKLPTLHHKSLEWDGVRAKLRVLILKIHQPSCSFQDVSLQNSKN